MTKKAAATKVILAFGESLTDCGALRELMLGLRPNLPVVQLRQRPIMLRRGTSLAKMKRMGSEIGRLLAAEAIRHNVIAIVVHRDFDDIEPSDDLDHPNALEADTVAALQPVLLLGCQIVPVVPAWETEAWWFLWPEQVAKHRPTWKPLSNRKATWVDRIPHAKETLIKELRPIGPRRTPDFSETDAPLIARLVRQDGVCRLPKGRSKGYERFVRAIDSLNA